MDDNGLFKPRIRPTRPAAAFASFVLEVKPGANTVAVKDGLVVCVPHLPQAARRGNNSSLNERQTQVAHAYASSTSVRCNVVREKATLKCVSIEQEDGCASAAWIATKCGESLPSLSLSLSLCRIVE